MRSHSSILTTSRVALLLTVAGAVCGASGCQKTKADPPAPKLAEVQYATPIMRTVTEHEEFSGRTWSPKMIEIRARVKGYLKEVRFKDGADVKAGDVLVQVDPEPYQAELDRTKATVEQVQSKVKQTAGQLKRAERLKTANSISMEEYENFRFANEDAVAALAVAKANETTAQLNLDFTTVKSPIDGRIGRRLVDPGNLVKEDDTHLATVVSLNPIHAYFDFDERSIVRMRRLVEEGKLQAAPDRSRPIQISLAGEDQTTLTGMIDWVDNQIDIGTGTLRSRVEIQNPDNFLSPGMFVRLRVPIGPEQQSILIPEVALGTDQGHRFVYVVEKVMNQKTGKEEDVPVYRRVDVGWLEGQMRVIEKGLSMGDKVIVTGLQRVRPKVPVIATPWTAQVAENAPAATNDAKTAEKPVEKTEDVSKPEKKTADASK
jgi:RND family efflux transporter MFP subunit